MIEQDMLEKVILELAALFQTGKPTKADPEAHSKLQEIIKSDGKGLPTVIKFIHRFPPEDISKAIAHEWEHLKEESRFKFLSEVIKLPKKDNDQKLRMIFVSQISRVDPEAALRLFKYTCEGSFDKKNHVFKPKLIKLVQSVLLNSIPPELIRLPIESNNINLNLIICCLNAAFGINQSDKGLIRPEVQYSVLKWVRASRTLSELPEAMIDSINGSITTWPLSMVPSLKEILVLFPEITKKSSEGVLRGILDGMREIAVPISKHVSLDRNSEPVQFTPQLALNNLGQYIHSLEKREDALREDYQKALSRIEETESELRSSGERMATLRRKIDQLEKGTGQLEESLKAERETCSQFSSQVNALEESLADVKRLSEELQHRIDAMVIENSAEVNKLVAKIDIESEHQINVFKAKLAGSLAIEYDDYRNVINKSMSTELGDSIREQLKRIFREA